MRNAVGKERGNQIKKERVRRKRIESARWREMENSDKVE